MEGAAPRSARRWRRPAPARAHSSEGIRARTRPAPPVSVGGAGAVVLRDARVVAGLTVRSTAGSASAIAGEALFAAVLVETFLAAVFVTGALAVVLAVVF